MKILVANSGTLTNFEVLDFFRSRGAAKDPTRIIAPIAPSEYKVYDYLEQTAASNQKREIIKEFFEKAKKYKLRKDEIINIINVRPSSVVEIDPIIEECDARMGESIEELVEMIVQVLPLPPSETSPPPSSETSDEKTGEEKVENPDAEQI